MTLFTQDEIIEMAKAGGAANFYPKTQTVKADNYLVGQEFLERFAKLVADVSTAKAWAEGYKQGVEDERTSEDNIGIAGFGMKVEPCRENPYASRVRGEAQ